MGGKSAETAEAVAKQLPTSKDPINKADLPCQKDEVVVQLGDLVVEIVDDQGKPITEDMAIAASGPAALSQTTKAGSHSFRKVAPGTYQVTVTPPPDDYDKPNDQQSSSAVTAGGQGKSRHVFKPKLNKVTPKIEVEYKVVLLDRQLAQHQDKPGETPLKPNATRIELTLTESDAAVDGAPYTGKHHPTQGGVLSCTPANVDIFLDEACATPLPPTGALTGDQLKPGSVLPLYLRGKTAGLFKAKITLNAPTDAFVVNDTAVVEVEMGVVELEMTVHQFVKADFDGLKADPDLPPPAAGKNYDPDSPGNDCAKYHENMLAHYHKTMKDLVLPDQKAMTDAQKIAGMGRMLSALRDRGGDRAKLVVKKLVAAQWPAGTDGYTIYLNRSNASGAVAVFDKAVDGAEQRLPVSAGMKVSELKAKAAEFWIEGTSATRAKADVQLDLSLDRDEGGLAKEVKRLGDAARFTVVDFTSLKVKFTPEANKPVRWDEPTTTFFVNLTGTGPGALAEAEARKVTLTAQLDPPLAGVTVHFTLAPDPKNQQAANSGEAIPPGGKVQWDQTVPLTISGPDAALFSFTGKRLHLKDGVLDPARKALYQCVVTATYSDGQKPQLNVYHWATKDVDTTAGLFIREYTAAHFPTTAVKLWKWNEIVRAVKHEDKTARDDFFHLSAVTDDKGVAECKLRLSRWGGDIFTPACYIGQDPSLARYVEDHADLGKRKPYLADKKIKVSRRAWVRKVAVEGVTTPDFAPAIGQYERVKVDLKQEPNLAVTRAVVNGYTPKAIYPRYMFEVNGGSKESLVVSNTNKRQFFTSFVAEGDKPNMIPILVCDAQLDGKNNSAGVTTPPRRKNAFPIEVLAAKNDRIAIDPPLKAGTLLVSGKWKAQDWNDTTNAWGPVREGDLVAADIDIDPNRSDLRAVRVALPDAAGATHSTQVWIDSLKIQQAQSFLGESFDKKILAVFDPKEEADFQNTIAHEVGHAFWQTPYPSTPSPHNEPVDVKAQTNPLKIPPHPNHYDDEAGNHCRHVVNTCVMYDSGPQPGSLNRYCKVCHPYLLMQDMTAIG